MSLIENWATNPTYMLVKENKTGILELPFSLFYAVRENMVINNPLFFKKWSFIQRKMFKNYFPHWERVLMWKWKKSDQIINY